MGNNLCSDVGNDPLPPYRASGMNPIISNPKINTNMNTSKQGGATGATGTALLHPSQWYDAKSKTEETGIPMLPEAVRVRLEELGINRVIQGHLNIAIL